MNLNRRFVAFLTRQTNRGTKFSKLFLCKVALLLKNSSGLTRLFNVPYGLNASSSKPVLSVDNFRSSNQRTGTVGTLANAMMIILQYTVTCMHASLPKKMTIDVFVTLK